MTDEFYVGYLPKAPRSMGRWMVRVVTGLVLAGLAAGAILLFDQAPFAPSKFEYGVYGDYTGAIEEWPYPILRTADSSFLLVAPGKNGLRVAGLQGKTVTLKGSLIERGTDRMLEVAPEPLRVTGQTFVSTAAAAGPVDLGHVRLYGEIVDSKCYLGVMNPGNGKVHRDCAARCISGGAPPAFVARDATGETRVLLLVGSDGRALNKEILSFVAEPLGIFGELVRAGSNLVLKAEPAEFRRESGINPATWCIR